MTCLKKEKSFYGDRDNCSLREITNEGKIIEKSQGDLIVLIVTDYAKMPPTQEIYMHALALQTVKLYWNDAWFETWDLSWLGGKGKGKNSNDLRGG